MAGCKGRRREQADDSKIEKSAPRLYSDHDCHDCTRRRRRRRQSPHSTVQHTTVTVMPPPRPRKLLARKSLATDPSLYLTPLDSDDDDAVPPLPPSAPPVAYPASGTKRRSARLSVEGTGNDSPAPLHHNKRSTTSTSRAKTPKSPAVPKSVKKDTGGKAKGRGRGEESEEEVIEETREEVDDVVEIQGRAPRGSNKRSKTGDKGGEGSAGTDTRLLVSIKTDFWWEGQKLMRGRSHALLWRSTRQNLNRVIPR